MEKGRKVFGTHILGSTFVRFFFFFLYGEICKIIKLKYNYLISRALHGH